MITFSAAPLPDPLPLNLLPDALPDVLGQGDTARAPTVIYRDAKDNLVSRVLQNLSGSESADSKDGVLPGLNRAVQDIGEEPFLLLGPRVPVAQGKPGPNEALGWPDERDPRHTMSDEIEIGIIDAGIAFWNLAFRKSGNPAETRFKTYGAISFDEREIIGGTALDAVELNNLAKLGDAEIRRKLGKRFPSSVYGKTTPYPLYRADGLAHGTAMTDLVVAEAPKSAPLHGLELPDSVLRDLTGGQMTALMDVALRRIVDQAANARSSAAPFRMVVLMAFGFTGGPQDGSAEILRPLEETLAKLAARNIHIRLVLPIGNHRQDRLHAQLQAKDRVDWRVVPKDYSANTVEIIQEFGSEALHISAPDGDTASLPPFPGLARLKHNGTDVGAVWVHHINDTHIRTRVTLSPSAAARTSSARAPFGAWSFFSPSAKADLWILRDETGFETDPSKPSRASWFEDPDYRDTDPLGRPAMADSPDSVIRRTGTASILATAKSPVVATAVVGHQGQAPYASLFMDGFHKTAVECDLAARGPSHVPVDQLPRSPGDGRAVLGNGGPQRFRITGTSLAAALHAGRLAHPGNWV